MLTINFIDYDTEELPTGFYTAMNAATEKIAICDLKMTVDLLKKILVACKNVKRLEFRGGSVTGSLAELDLGSDVEYKIQKIRFYKNSEQGEFDFPERGFADFKTAASKTSLKDAIKDDLYYHSE